MDNKKNVKTVEITILSLEVCSVCLNMCPVAEMHSLFGTKSSEFESLPQMLKELFAIEVRVILLFILSYILDDSFMVLKKKSDC